MNKLRACLIGAGSMGANHARTIAKSEHSELVLVIDSDSTRAEALARIYGSKHSQDLEFAIKADYVIVASSTASHYEVVSSILNLGIPILVEKPICNSLQELESLHAAVTASGQLLLCGFVERFNPAFLTLQEILTKPLALYSTRHSPGLSRATNDVDGDLLIHDLDLAIKVFGATPVNTFTNSYSVEKNQTKSIRDAMDVLCSFSDNRMANLSVSRLSQRKTRRIDVIDDGRLIEVDMLRRNVSIFRNVEEEISPDGIGYKQLTVIEIPSISHYRDPLAAQLDFFVDLIKGRNNMDVSQIIQDAFSAHWEIYKLSR